MPLSSASNATLGKLPLEILVTVDAELLMQSLAL
jgi:hypothetical protein